jgi:hypothetical protein
MDQSTVVRHTGAPLKHRASKIDDEQSGLVIAQEVTKSTATIQGCMSRESNMRGMLQLSTI